MPKQTNDFQELFALIQQALAPKSAKITESAMVEVQGLTTFREVDVLIEGEFGAFKMKVAVEAKDESRKFDVTALEAYLAKYRGECRVQVDKFVIVTRKGYTEGALEKAKATDVELFTLEEAKHANWSKFGPGVAWLNVAPHICKLALVPAIDAPLVEILKARMVCKCCGRDVGSLHELSLKWSMIALDEKHPELGDEFKARLKDRGEAVANVGWDEDRYDLLIGDQKHSPTQIQVVLHAASAKGSATFKEYRYESSKGTTRNVKHFQAEVGRKRLSVVMPDGFKSKQIVVKIDDIKTADERRAIRRQRAKAEKKSKRKNRHR